MNREDSAAAGTVIVAFILGAVTGAAVALLMAPTTGGEMRRMLGDKAREGRDRAAGAAQQGRDFLNRQRDHLSTAVERGREAYRQARGGTVSDEPGGGAETL